MQDTNCACPCGRTRFGVKSAGLTRVYCHCTICQAFNQAAYADITLFKAAEVIKPDLKDVNYQAYKKTPPAVQRGRCSHCDQPAIEFIKLPLLPELVIVPSANIKDQTLVPEPHLHMFYHRRVSECDDDLPKYSGFLSSQWGFGKDLLAALLPWR